MMKTGHDSSFLLSLVVPCLNEEDVIREFHNRVLDILKSMPVDFEIIYINDGGSDDTIKLLKNIRSHEPRVSIIDFSRNFGKEIALSAGLDHARGDAVVVIDADLQDPPELIPELFDALLEGNDVVYARRKARHGETFLKKFTARWFYRVMGLLVKPPIPQDTGDFRMLSRRAVEALRRFREQHRFMKGLFAWIGYPKKEIFYSREALFAGKTKWNYWKLWNFALEGITSFSIGPLKVSTYLGLATAVFAFIYALVIVYKTVFFGESVQGYPSLMVVILFLGGVQLTVLGILGEYVGRIFNETKQRPLYIIKDYIPWGGKDERQNSGDKGQNSGD